MGRSRAPNYKVAAGAPDDDEDALSTTRDEDHSSVPVRHSVTVIKPVGSSRGVHARHSHQTPTRLFRRLLGLGAACWYVQICSSACIGIWNVLTGKQQTSTMDVMFYESQLMLPYMGAALVRDSPLVLDVLQNDTMPRNNSVYLRAEAEVSTDDCDVSNSVAGLYVNEFQRQFYERILLDTQYNLSFLQQYELVVPVIDCTFTGIVADDPTAFRLFYIMRALADPDDLRLLTLITQTADYQLVDRSTVHGATLLVTATFLQDLSANEVTHYFILAIGYPFIQLSLQVYEYVAMMADGSWVLASVPNSAAGITKRVQTACRQGIYKHNEREQSNTANTIWKLHQNPLQVISELQYTGRPTLRNSWAWVHMVHLFLAADMVLNLLLLVTIGSNHVRHHRQLWLGDAFMVLNSRLWALIPTVLLSWYIEGFWTLLEFCIHDGNAITKTQDVFIYESIMRADLMILCISLADLLGRLAKERIEPTLVIAIFYGIFKVRLSILQWSSVLTEIVTTYTDADYNLAIQDDPSVSLITPMRLWSIHELEQAPIRFVGAALMPVFGSFIVCITVYILARKVKGKMVHRPTRVSRASSSRGTHAQRLATLTVFEAATGTELLDRHGVVSDYENLVVVRSSHFAAADAVYSSGFVIANGKFLVQTEHVWAIALMLLLRVRFMEIYAYEVEDHRAQECALLVEPDTLSLRDLLLLDISALA